MPKPRFLSILISAAALGGAGLFAPPAHATLCPTGTDVCSQLTHSNFGSDSDFGSVAVDITSSGVAHITFTAASGFSFLNNQIVDLNSTTITSTTVTNLTTTPVGTPTPAIAAQGSGQVDGFGTLSFTTDPTMGNNGTHFTNIAFDVSGTFGTNAGAVLAFNAQGFDAAAHMIGPSTVNNGLTFFVAEPVPAPVIGHGLLVLLAVGGVLFGGKLLEHSKRRSSLGTA